MPGTPEAKDCLKGESATMDDFRSALVSALPYLRRVARRFAAGHHDIDDLVQATIMGALASERTFQPGTNIQAWLATILRNRHLSTLRRYRPMSPLDDVAEAKIGQPSNQEESLAVQDVEEAIAKLGLDQQRILRMIVVEGISYQEASDELGIAIGTLKFRIFSARDQLYEVVFGEKRQHPGADGVASQRKREAFSPA